MKWLALALVLVLGIGALFAQDAEINLNPEDAIVNTPAITINSAAAASVFCIICDSEPSKFIILNQDGQWIPDVQSAIFAFESNKTAEITCIIWVGPYKPTKPTTKTWSLDQIMTVSKDVFDKYVDDLQKDPGAVAKSLAG